jgi:transposase
MSFHLETEKDVERLRQAALLLEAENKRLVARVVELTRKLLSAQGHDAEELQLRLQELERQLAQRTGELFGRSSEKRPRREQDEGKQAEPARGHGPRTQPTLPLLEEVHTLEEPDKQCPKCGEALAEMKGCYEDAEEVDVVERRFVLRRHKRQKSAAAAAGAWRQPWARPSFSPAGATRWTSPWKWPWPNTKYLMPLERQVRTMEREGLVVDSQTLWDQIDALAAAGQQEPDALARLGAVRPPTPWCTGYRRAGTPRPRARC